MKRALLVMVVVVLVGAGVVSGYLWGHHSNTTLPVSDNGASALDWTGMYFWQSGPADAPTDAVLLTLLQSPSGVSGTWTETALNNGLGVDNGGQGSYPVGCSDVTSNSMTMTVDGSAAPTFQVTSARAPVGLSLTYTPFGGGIQTVNLTRITSAEQYNQMAQAVNRQKN